MDELVIGDDDIPPIDGNVRHRFMSYRSGSRIRYQWDVFNRVHGCSFWFIMPDAHDCLAGIESHYFVHESKNVFPCDLSPTGFCRPDGTSLGGQEWLERFTSIRGGSMVVEVRRIWRALRRRLDEYGSEPHPMEKWDPEITPEVADAEEKPYGSEG